MLRNPLLAFCAVFLKLMRSRWFPCTNCYYCVPIPSSNQLEDSQNNGWFTVNISPLAIFLTVRPFLSTSLKSHNRVQCLKILDIKLNIYLLKLQQILLKYKPSVLLCFCVYKWNFKVAQVLELLTQWMQFYMFL